MGFTGSFTASSEYKNEAKTIGTGEMGSAVATASCIKAKYSLSKATPPCMSNELKEFIDVMLEDIEDDDILTEFFDNFGTHAVTGIEMGDKFVAKTSFSRKEYEKNRHNGGHLTFDADMGFFTFVTATAHSNSEFTHDDNSSGNSRLDTSEMYTIGTPLPEGTTVADKLDAWISDNKNNDDAVP